MHERMHPDINELLSEVVRRYPILYDKTLKEFKDRKMKSQKLKISQLTYRMLARLPEIIFPVTQPKLFDKVIAWLFAHSYIAYTRDCPPGRKTLCRL